MDQKWAHFNKLFECTFEALPMVNIGKFELKPSLVHIYIIQVFLSIYYLATKGISIRILISIILSAVSIGMTVKGLVLGVIVLNDLWNGLVDIDVMQGKKQW